jgi:hypothetical protein
MTHDGTTHYHYWVSGRSGADGRFRLQGVRPDLPPTLLVRQDGWATLVFHLPQAVIHLPENRGEHDAGRIEMRKPRLVTGQLLDADGKPVARASVRLWGSNDDRCRMAMLPGGPLGSWDLLRGYVDLHKARTDGNGSFAFGDIAPGTYKITVYGPRNDELASVEGIAVKADADPAPVIVNLGK